jgi:hypothetical protein
MEVAPFAVLQGKRNSLSPTGRATNKKGESSACFIVSPGAPAGSCGSTPAMRSDFNNFIMLTQNVTLYFRSLHVKMNN